MYHFAYVYNDTLLSQDIHLLFQLAHQPLLIVAYQRTGSSFFNAVLNVHPDVISWYEPLDGMFSKLYGIQQGYTVPVDIYADQFGNERYNWVIAPLFVN